MLNINFIGIGACGSNICDIAEKHNYRTAVINTSKEDLECLANVKHKLLVGTEAGCGKDRNIAKKEVKLHYKEIVEFVKNNFTEDRNTINYVVFSTGGGTGSGMGPIILDLLVRMFPEKHFGVIAVLPSLSESLVAQYNSLENLNEIMKLNVPTLIVDNEKFELEQKLTKKQLFDSVNECIISDFNLLIKDRQASKYGNIDDKDMLKLLTTAGNMVISTKKIFPDSQEDINKLIVQSWDTNSIYTDLEYDNAVKRMGYIYEIPDNMTKDIDYSKLYIEAGRPLETFEGYYTPDSDIYSVISILAGLSFSEKRIKKIKEVLNNNKQNITSAKTVNVLDSDDSNWFNGLREEPKKSSSLFTLNDDGEDSLDLDNLFGNY